MTRVLNIFTDGGSRGNPGPAACSFIALLNNKEIYKEGFFIGTTTNNVAEYYGLKKSLEWLLNYLKTDAVDKIEIYMDSELIVRQINGSYKVKNNNLIKIFLEIKSLLDKINFKYSIIHTKRVNNKNADLLVNKILNENKFNFT
jgi:ribonuclease HI